MASSSETLNDISAQSESFRNALERALRARKDANWELELLITKVAAVERWEPDGAPIIDPRIKTLIPLCQEQDTQARELLLRYGRIIEGICSARTATSQALTPTGPEISVTTGPTPPPASPVSKKRRFSAAECSTSTAGITVPPSKQGSGPSSSAFHPDSRPTLAHSASSCHASGSTNNSGPIIIIDPQSRDRDDDVSPRLKRMKLEHPPLTTAPATSNTVTAARDDATSSSRAPFIRKPMSNLKLEKTDVVIEKSALHRRFDKLGSFPLQVNLDPSLEHFHVSRQFMTSEYGGSKTLLLPRVAQKRRLRHGYDDFMYPSFEYGPYLPQWPGQHGLLFRVDDGTRLWASNGNRVMENRQPIQRVLVQDQYNAFRYVGQYKLTRLEDLSKEEWSVQSQKVKNTWISEDSLSKRCMKPLLARVFLRRFLGREPTPEEVEKQINDKTTKLVNQVTYKEVTRAFNNGQENLVIWGMKCISFDHDFLRQLVDKYPKWVENQENSG